MCYIKKLFILVLMFPWAHVHAETTELRGGLGPPQSPTRVLLKVFIESIEKIDPVSENTPMIKASLKLSTEWKDFRLVNKENRNEKAHVFNGEEASAKLNQIFDPSISALDGDMTISGQHLQITSGGKLKLTQHVDVEMPADMELLKFPFDSQKFTFRFASKFWTDDKVDLILNSPENSIEEDALPDSWNFNYISQHSSSAVGHGQLETYSTIDVSIHATRDPGYFLWHLLLPLICIVILSWNVFWVYSYEVQSLENCLIFLLTVVGYHAITTDMLPVIPFFTYFDALIYISYLYTVIPTVLFLVGAVFDYSNRSEIATQMRVNSKWIVPLSFCVINFAVTLHYFTD